MTDEVERICAKLLPCPFCGGIGRIESSSLSTLSWPVWEHLPRCPFNAAIMYNSPEEALAAGNTRLTTTDEGMRKALEAWDEMKRTAWLSTTPPAAGVVVSHRAWKDFARRVEALKSGDQ